MMNSYSTVGVEIIPAGSTSGTHVSNPTTTTFASSNASSCSIPSNHNSTSNKEPTAPYFIDGSLQVLVLQLRQLICEGSVVLKTWP